MLTFFIAFLLIATIIAAMAVGVIFQNKPIKGSCGGMAALGMDTACEICGGNQAKCDEVSKASSSKASAASFYDASK